MFQLPYGTSFIPCRLEHVPYDWIRYHDPLSSGKPAGPDDLERALDRPIASPPLEQLARGKSRAVILISDSSRLVPTADFLELLVNRLNRAGLPDSRIQVIVALGLHRKQTDDELVQLAGERVRNRVQVLNHSALEEHCILVGHTSRGTPVEINRHVVEADLRIATGNIEPHRLVGISGGVKALVPGAASRRFIEAHHAMSRQYKAEPGNPDNPLHRDLEEAAALVPLHFLFNVIVNHERKIVKAVCGEVTAAHRAGVEWARRMFTVPAAKQYDVVIVSPGGHPKDMHLYQTIKTLQNAAQIAKPGGRIICAARCEEHYGNGVLQSWIETIHDPDIMLEKLSKQFVPGAHKVEHIRKLVGEHRVYLYSQLPPPAAKLAGFDPVENLQALLDEIDREGRERKLSVAVMPFGALTFPVRPSTETDKNPSLIAEEMKE